MPTGIVAVGQNPPVSYSVDNGYTWKTGIGVAFPFGRSVVYNGSLWVAVGEGSPGELQNIATSVDGINWIPRSTSSPFVGWCVAWNGSYWLAGAGSTFFAKSFDGINWTLYPSPQVSSPVTCLAWGNGVWVAGFGTAIIAAYTSPDGQTWSPIAQFQNTGSDPLASVYDITWDGTKFLIAVVSNTLYVTFTSSDTITWTGSAEISPTPSGTRFGYAVGFNGSSYLRSVEDAVNYAQISNNGNTWVYINDPIAQAGFLPLAFGGFGFKQIIWTGTEWMFAKFGNPILHSADGLVWSQSTPLGIVYAFALGIINLPPPQINFPHMIQNIKLPDGPKDVACNTAARCHPIAPYRNIPEPAVTPSNPGQRFDCITRSALPYANYGTAYNRYSPYQKTTYTVGYNRLPGSRIAETWPPPSNK